MNLSKTLPVVETAAVWLFLLQAFRVLFATLFGVIYDAVFDQALSPILAGLDLLLVVLAMLTPLLLRHFGNRPRVQLGATLLVFAIRVLISIANPTLQLYASILLLGAAALYITHQLWHEPEHLMTGFLVGLGADQMLRALDYSYDPTLRPSGLPFVVVAALLLALLSLYLARGRTYTAKIRPHLSTGLALGAVLFVETSLLALPNGVSRWSGIGYNWTAPLLLLVTLLPLTPAARALEQYVAISLWPLESIIFVSLSLLCVVLAALTGGGVTAVLLLLGQFLLLLNFTTGVIKKRIALDSNPRLPGLEVSLGLLLFLLLSFAFAFTFTYAYTVSLFRGLGTLFILIATLIAMLPVFNIMLEPEVREIDHAKLARNLGGIVALTVICAVFTRLPTLRETPVEGTVRLATYNIHYGFNTDWNFNLAEIAETIEAESVDIVVLQEVDAGRITSYSVDDALWLGQRLKMHVVYQPTLEKLSGIALLSRYPLDTGHSGGQWLSSALEQTAIVHGVVKTRHAPLHAYGIWLGLEPEERATQIAEALDYIGSENPVALGGDFNATPDSPIYTRVLDADFNDPFTVTGQYPSPTSPAIDPAERIDYVWLRGLTPRRAWVPDSIASDHRMVVIEAELNPQDD